MAMKKCPKCNMAMKPGHKCDMKDMKGKKK